MTTLTYLCDTRRHLICIPYSIENLHRMAEDLGIKRCWFHKNHYDIPMRRGKDIMARCQLVSSREIFLIIKGAQNGLFSPEKKDFSLEKKG